MIYDIESAEQRLTYYRNRDYKYMAVAVWLVIAFFSIAGYGAVEILGVLIVN